MAMVQVLQLFISFTKVQARDLKVSEYCLKKFILYALRSSDYILISVTLVKWEETGELRTEIDVNFGYSLSEM